MYSRLTDLLRKKVGVVRAPSPTRPGTDVDLPIGPASPHEDGRAAAPELRAPCEDLSERPASVDPQQITTRIIEVEP
eukprot:m.80778 g.80778  ORF g.80778 m.80778 type:complete len:77 (-) comp50698_c0_seq6:582-812(-)